MNAVWTMQFRAGRLLHFLGATAIFALASVSAQSAVFIVTNTNDSGAGSLRDTIAAATHGDTIQFDPALNGQAITLTSGQLEINRNLTIAGPGANQLTVQRSTANGTPAFRIFATSNTVTLTGLTIANGNTSESGGGIFFLGLGLTIANCVITGNSAANGGGIYGSSTFLPPSVSITNSVISGNSAAYGGGIYINQASFPVYSQPCRLTMTNSTISGNVATSGGGGLFNSGVSTITNSTISANVATLDGAGGGGGISNEGRLTVANSPSPAIRPASVAGSRTSNRKSFFTLAYRILLAPPSLTIRPAKVAAFTHSVRARRRPGTQLLPGTALRTARM